MKKFHYVYKLINIKPFDDRKYYIGCRSCSCQPEKDYYFSSSKIIKNIIKKHGNTFKKEIIKLFNNRKDAILYEMKLHNEFNVALNKEYYNKSNQSSNRFDSTGLIYINGNPISTENYIGSGLKYHSYEKITVKDADGNTKCVSIYDERYKNGDLVPVSSGRMPILNNKLKSIETKEYYKNKDKYHPTNKNKVAVKDANNNSFLIDKDDERYKNGEFVSVHIGKVLSKDVNGNIRFVTIDEFKNNNLVGINKGIICGSNNPNSKIIKIFNVNDELIYICDGNFENICVENNLPFASFRKSYLNGGNKIYNSKRGITESIKLGYEKYIGWYAISESKK